MNALAGTDAFLRVGVFERKHTILFRGCNVEIYDIRCIKKASVINAALHLLSKSYEGWNLNWNAWTSALTLLLLRSVSAALFCVSPSSYVRNSGGVKISFGIMQRLLSNEKLFLIVSRWRLGKSYKDLLQHSFARTVIFFLQL